jgi:hypothetical protein
MTLAAQYPEGALVGAVVAVLATACPQSTQ